MLYTSIAVPSFKRALCFCPVTVLWLFIFAAAAYCGAAFSPETAKGPVVPSGVLLHDGNCLVVDKSSQKLMLYRTSASGVSLVNSYDCSTGSRRGDKKTAGDKKTPQGVYLFTRHYTDGRLPSRYGSMAFVLDFPNYIDRGEDKGGNGIWLHGLDRPLVPFDTQGCIALNNEDLQDVSGRIRLYETPVIIEEAVQYVPLQQAQKKAAEALLFIEKWHRSWQKKNLDDYFRCYAHTSFGGRTWRQWKQHKRELCASYKFIHIELSGISIFEHDGTVAVHMTQDYESDSFHSIGLKKLFLRNYSDTLQIVGEEWIRVPAVEIATLQREVSSEREMCRFLNSWVTAWERKNLETYMSCYSRAFYTGKMDRNSWRHHKARIFRSDNAISITVLKPSVIRDGNQATVSFLQKYLSGTYGDYGEKILRLRVENGSWKITCETWQAEEPAPY